LKKKVDSCFHQQPLDLNFHHHVLRRNSIIMCKTAKLRLPCARCQDHLNLAAQHLQIPPIAPLGRLSSFPSPASPIKAAFLCYSLTLPSCSCTGVRVFMQMRNSEESSSTAPTSFTVCRPPARVWREFHVCNRHQKIKDPCFHLFYLRMDLDDLGGVPLEVFAKIVDEAILVQYAAY
jgi:hypothetical protein